MRILIVNADTAFECIAGEMLNIEYGVLHFIDGKPAKENYAANPGSYVGYPRIDAGCRIDYRACKGYVYIPKGLDVGEFIEKLGQTVSKMDKEFNDSGRFDGKKSPTNYRSTYITYSTTVYIDCDNSRSIKSYDDKKASVTTFTWYVMPIDKITFNIRGDEIDRAFAMFGASIFWDRDMISKHNHNDTTFSFNYKTIKGSENITGGEITVLKNHDNSLCVELSKYWKAEDVKMSRFRNLDKKIYQANFEDLLLKKTYIGGKGYSDICSRCHDPLYGEFYALFGDTRDSDLSPYCVPICALCMHYKHLVDVEKKYLKIFRVTYPRTAADLLELNNVTSRDLYMKFLLHNTHKKQGTIPYISFGDYCGVYSIDEYLFNGLVNNDEFAGKKICKVTVIE